ncbi:MAG: DUF2064 domain-containing protein [Elusimicrobia bacterium]|nr:DUF2064 domain-containing protein [Elusimicrobiota bacterium]
MAKNRDNSIILLVDPPEADKVIPELKTAFGPERAVHVNSDLLTSVYKLAKNFNDAILILSYAKSARHPDLTWLDPEDPGFLEVKHTDFEERLQEAVRLAFFTGAKKAVLISHLSPELKSDWIQEAINAVNDRTVAIGANTDGTYYLVGLTQPNLKIFEPTGFSRGKSGETLAERARRNKLAVFSTPETYTVTGEETLLRWMENKETLPPIFTAQHAGPPAAEPKKHHRRPKHESQEPPAEKPQI